MNAPLIVTVGPTASGKSDFAMQIAKQHDGEIICADSRTIYKGMDIGTAKPSAEDRREIPHHMLDLVNPNEQFTVADFKRQAQAVIQDIWQRGKWPIMVGGSGLYVDSVLFDYHFGKPADPAKRARLSKVSVEELQNICRRKNIELPENYLNKRHLIRSIELGGLIQQKRTLRDNTVVVGITLEMEELKKRIEKRAIKMREQGVLDEAARLGARFGWDSEAMRGNMYRVLQPVVAGDQSIEEAIEEAIRSDIRLVKKQLTWFRRNPHIVWGGSKDLIKAVDQFVKGHSR